MSRKKKEKNASSRKKTTSSSVWEYFSELTQTIKEEIQNIAKHLPGPWFRYQNIIDGLNIRDPKLYLLYQEVFQELVLEGKIIPNQEGLFRWHENATEPSRKIEIEDVSHPKQRKPKALHSDEFIGTVEHVNRAYAYVVVEGLESDIYVDTDDLRGAIDGDQVKVQLYGRRRNSHDQGRVTAILSPAKQNIVGVLKHGGRYAFVKPDNRRIYEPIDIPLTELNGAENGHKVIVEITHRATRARPAMGRVVSVLGNAGDHHTEMHAILAEFGLPNEFPEEVQNEAQYLPETITAADLKGRKDLRNIATFTIDPLDAKDFDDALSFKKLPNGNFEVGIHIADVSHYVLPDTALDREAFHRGNSVYLVDRTIPMLPEKISNFLCSLRPHEDKLAFSAVFELTEDAKIVKEWFGRTVIHSDRRFTYEEAQEVIETGTGDFHEELKTLNELAKILQTERFSKGAINFETTEVKFVLDEAGKPLGLHIKERKDAHKLIEEFMLLANRRVPEFIRNLSKKKSEPNTMIYRIHEPPDREKLATFSTFVSRLGYTLNVSGTRLARSFNDMLKKAEGKPEQNLLENLAVRTMAKARYSTEEIGHFGLAFKRYSHFTSPIRRYPDLIAHRLLQHYLQKGASVDKDSLEKKCLHCSEREKLATEAERASIKYKQVEYMSLQDEDRTYDGVISGVTEFGIFVEIIETASEGLVRMNDLTDDYYELDKENYRLVGEKSGRIFAFGDKVQVKVKETNLSKRSMDLLLVGFAQTESKPKGKRGSAGRTKRQKENPRRR